MSDFWVEVALWFGSLFVVAAFFMRAILPLRLFALASNVAFLIYALGAGILATTIVHLLLLPLNIFRIRQHLDLRRRIRNAARDVPEIGKLIPLMSRQSYAAGDTLFQRGDKADAMYVVIDGQVSLPEVGKILTAGAVLGEIALFLNDKSRTTSARCDTACTICALTEDRVTELVMTDPAFGMFLTKLIATRMTENYQNANQSQGAAPEAT